MKRPVILIATLLLAAAPAAAQEGRIDARLRFNARYGASPAALAARVPAVDAVAAAARVRAIVRVLPGGIDALSRHGARLGAVAGDVVTATIPLAALPALAAERTLVFLEAAAWIDAPTPPASSVRVTRDSAGIDNGGFDILRQRAGDNFEGATGANVIVGFYDSGIDPRHEDFLDAHGGSRILYAWDQTVDGAPPGALGASSFDYGMECSTISIDAGVCPLRDINGHGTHVAGIAAGDGSATGGGLAPYRFIGAAPQASLIVVKGGDFGYTSDRLLDGVAYIFARAAELGLPAVVNLSIGTQTGPHDGSSVFERGLQNLLGPGRIIVAAAGNQGNNKTEFPAFPRQSLHTMGDLVDGADAHELIVPPYTRRAGNVNDAAVLELWYHGDDEITVGVRAPSGNLVAYLEPGDSLIALSPEGAVYIDNASGGVDPNSGKRLALISLFDAEESAVPAAGTWRIELERAGGSGHGDYHMWLVGSNLSTPFELTTFGAGATNTHLIALPGTAERFITVAAHVTRHAWTAQSGEQEYPFREEVGELAHFSSPGPRTDDVLKPDLSAPGKVVVSARSRDAILWDQLPAFIDADGVHAVNLGTSMSAPYAAGAVALLLQFASDLTPEEARALLTASARHDVYTSRSYSLLPPGSPNPHWGHGKLDAAAALHLLPIAAGTLHVTARALAPATRVSAASGTRVALLHLEVAPDSVEAVHLRRIAVDIDGDVEGRVIVIEDGDADGMIDDEERVVGSAVISGTHVTVETDAVVRRGGADAFIVALELAAGMRHGERFSLSLRSADIEAVGVLSGVLNAWQQAPPEVVSPAVAVTVLEPDERWSLSENPVRSDRVILTFAEAPRRAHVYTLSGALVKVLDTGPTGERAEWTLENQNGGAVASGLYLLLVEFDDAVVTRKLMVLRGS